MFHLNKLNETKEQASYLKVGIYLMVVGIKDTVIKKIYRDVQFKKYGISFVNVEAFETYSNEEMNTYVEFEAIIELNKKTAPHLKLMYELLQNSYPESKDVSDYTSKVIVFNLICLLHEQIILGAIDAFVMLGYGNLVPELKEKGIDMRVEFVDTITDLSLNFTNSMRDPVTMDIPKTLMQITDDIII